MVKLSSFIFFYIQVTYHPSVPLDLPALEVGHVFVNRFPLPSASKYVCTGIELKQPLQVENKGEELCKFPISSE